MNSSKDISAEFQATAKQYGGEEAYNQAKQAGKTKLNYHQWVQVRTPSFKAWFGDWEKAAQIEKLRHSETIIIHGNEISPSEDLKQFKRNALEYGKQLRGTYTNKDTGLKIRLDRNGIQEVLCHDYKDIEHLQSIVAVPQIIENSIFLDKLPNEDKTKHPDIKEFEYYLLGLKIGKVDYTVRAVVAITTLGDKYYDHKLTQIKKGDLLSITSRVSTAEIGNSSPFQFNDKRLLSILQVGDISKVIDPETGEPMVVYHGTTTEQENGRFNQFKPTRATKKGHFDLSHGGGIYFTPSKERAEDFAGFHQKESMIKRDIYADESLGFYPFYPQIYGVFLNIKNPQPKNLGNFNTAKERKMAGFDGVISMNIANPFYDEIVVNQSNQIKSATDNTGEFNVKNPDIRYSIDKKAREKYETQINEVFNHELKQFTDGELTGNHVFNMGRPNALLQASGFPNLPIELKASKLTEKSSNQRHPFDVAKIANLPEALNNPLAIFSYGDSKKAQNIITSLESEGKQFLVGVHFNQQADGLLVNSVRGLFPKDTAEWLNWVSQKDQTGESKLKYIDKKRVQNLIDQQRTNLADVEYLELNSVESIIQNHENVNPDLYELAHYFLETNILEQSQTTAEQETHRQNIQATVEKAVGKKNAKHIKVVNLNDILRPDNAKDLLSEGGEVEGFYNPKTQQVTIIADNVDSTTASLVAWHELGHRGIDTKGFSEFKSILERADNNPTINTLADRIVQSRAGTIDEAVNERIVAIEEAVVELYAAMKTNDWQAIEDKYQITIPQNIRAPKGVIGRIIDRMKQVIGKALGVDKVSDQHIYSLLNTVDKAVHEDHKTTSQEQKKYSLNEANNSAFAKAVDAVAKSEEAPTNYIKMGTTPPILQKIGLPKTGIFIRGGVLQKVMKEKHAVSAQSLKDLPKQINDPVAVMQSAPSASRTGHIVLTELTEQENGKDKPLVAILHLNHTRNGIEVINIASVYGRSLPQIQKALDNDLMYWHKTKGSQFINAFGLQLPSKSRLDASLSEDDIKTEKDLAQAKLDEQKKYSIIGEKGARSLDRKEASRHRADNLQVAKDMENANKDAKTIRLATGWECGADGKWRYEIDSSQARLIDSERFDLYLAGKNPTTLTAEERAIFARIEKELPPLFQKVDEAEKKLNQASQSGDYQQIYLAEIEMEEATKPYYDLLSEKQEIESIRNHGYRFLEEVLIYPELYEAYPAMGEIKVNFNLGFGTIGVYSGAPRFDRSHILLEEINITAKDKESLLSVLLHEIQHAIQRREGFADGGSPRHAVQLLQDQAQRDIDKKQNFIDTWRNDKVLAEERNFKRTTRELALLQSAQKLRKYAKGDNPSRVLRHIEGEINLIHYVLLDIKNNIIDVPESIISNIKDLELQQVGLPARKESHFTHELRRLANNTAEVFESIIRPSTLQEIQAKGLHKIIDDLAKFGEKNTRSAQSASKIYSEIHALKQWKKVIDNTDSYELYRRLAGEVEARNVESRMGMSAQERRETPLSDTEDKTRDEQIVLHVPTLPSSYSLNESSNSAFAKAVDAVVRGENVTGYVKVGTTPEVLKMIGLPDAKVTINATVLTKVMDGKHNITPNVLKQLPKQINDPVAIMKSAPQASHKGYVVLTELKEGKEPIVVALHINKTAKDFDIINIVSAYGKNLHGLQNMINHDVVYWNETKGLHMVTAFGLQLPSQVQSYANLSKANIKTEKDLAQGQPENIRYSRQGSEQAKFNHFSQDKTMTTEKNSSAQQQYAEEIANQLIEQLKAGTAPWQKPWTASENNDLNYNRATGREYTNSNQLRLMMEGEADPRWMTYKQANNAGFTITKGAKGVRLMRVNADYWRTKKDENGKPILDSEGQPVKEKVLSPFKSVRFFTVFNGKDIEGLPPLEKQSAQYDWQANQKAEEILQNSNATIIHKASNRAYYSPLKDHIVLPEKAQFPDEGKYYATALHELGHWTGHPDRLNRDLAHVFGSQGYAKEELRAEIASMMLSRKLGIEHDPSQHVAYVESWVQILKDHPQEILAACNDSAKIQDYVMGFAQLPQIEQSKAQETTPANPLPDYTETRTLPDWMIYPNAELGTIKVGDQLFEDVQITHIDDPRAEVVMKSLGTSFDSEPKTMYLMFSRQQLKELIQLNQDNQTRKLPESWQVNHSMTGVREDNQERHKKAIHDFTKAFQTAPDDEKRQLALKNGVMENLLHHIPIESQALGRMNFYESEIERLNPSPLPENPAATQGFLFDVDDEIER